MKRFFIITGTSRGLGAALAKSLMGEGNFILGVSRQSNKELVLFAEQNNFEFTELLLDLSQHSSIELVSEASIHIIKSKNKFNELVLINNAGVLEPVGSLSQMSLQDLIFNLEVNVIATLGLTNRFISHLERSDVKKLVINISSGAGRNPYEGWSAYCASKAAVDMFSKCVGLEEQKKTNGVHVYSIAPGVIETSMQETIRSKSMDEFPMINKFLDLKENNLLKSPEEVANSFKAFIESAARPSEVVCNINDLIQR